MKLIVELPKEYYAIIKHDVENHLIDYRPFEIIANGTPLPEDHGRLIDADAYIDKYEECGWLDDIAVNEFNAITPTIIEATKRESEE